MIIKPQGKTVKRVHMEFDSNGQAQIRAELILPNGQTAPMHPLELALICSQIVSNNIAAFAQGQGAVLQQREEKTNGKETTETDPSNHS